MKKSAGNPGKILRAAAPLLLLSLTVAVWAVLPAAVRKDSVRYAGLVEAGDGYFGKRIYLDASECYRAALDVDPSDYGLRMKYIRACRQLGDHAAFIDGCEAAMAAEPGKSGAYEELAGYYYSSGKYTDAYSVIGKARRAGCTAAGISELEEKMACTFTDRFVFVSAALDWHFAGGKGYAAAQTDGKWGLLGNDGKKLLAFSYDSVGMYDDESGLVNVSKDGEWYYVDLRGRRRLAPGSGYEYLGPFSGGIAPACRDGVWGYIDRGGREVRFGFDYAGAFAGGIAAVMSDGSWSLINSRFVSLTGSGYDGILVDAYGFAAAYGTAVALRDGLYYFIAPDGTESESGFTDARLPASYGGNIAVRLDEGWGFADREGNVVLRTFFTDAGSFSCGIAPAGKDGGWFFINEKGERVTPEGKSYSFCGCLSPDGAAFAGTGDCLNILLLCAFSDG